MNKSIKVQEQVYHQLEDLRGKRETFSEVVERLLKARPRIIEAYDLIAGAASYRPWKRENGGGHTEP